MPTLTLIFKGQTLALDLAKIDRDRLYGYAETETKASDGSPCTRATLADDGQTLAGPGDSAIAYLSPDGLWRTKAELHAVDAADGAAVVPVKSTFAFPVDLAKKETSLDDYLAHAVRLVYALSFADEAIVVNHPLIAELAKGSLFKFPFSYRGGDLANAGFLMLGADGNIYLAVATPLVLAYARLDAPAAIVGDEDLAEEEEEELDFAMV